MGFVVTLIAQLVQPRFEIRLVLAQFERRQHATIVGAVAAVVEQGMFQWCPAYAGTSATRPVIPGTRS
jgi:hypothetical protein